MFKDGSRRHPPPLGQVFGRLTVIGEGPYTYGHSQWMCRCTCGRDTSVSAQSLQRGLTRSCGCLRREVIAARRGTARSHGMSRTSTYRSYRSMLNRCLNPNSPDYVRYGGRGIRVCARWLKSFENFLSDVGPRPDGLTLDRYPDKDGDYTPRNVRWATPQEQGRNRRSSRMITWKGKRQSLIEWSLEVKLEPATLTYRLKRGWSLDRAFTTPSLIPRKERK